jgi:hypothetical protein
VVAAVWSFLGSISVRSSPFRFYYRGLSKWKGRWPDHLWSVAPSADYSFMYHASRCFFSLQTQASAREMMGGIITHYDCPVRSGEWRFAIHLPCEIHVHMIDGARERAKFSARLDRRPATRVSPCRMKRRRKKNLGNAFVAHVKPSMLQSQQHRETAHAQEHVGIFLVSRYHGHFVRLRLRQLASQGESELPEVAQVASQRSDERTHILITFGLAEWQQRARLASSTFASEGGG